MSRQFPIVLSQEDSSSGRRTPAGSRCPQGKPCSSRDCPHS
jgi:hypothetical protein